MKRLIKFLSSVFLTLKRVLTGCNREKCYKNLSLPPGLPADVIDRRKITLRACYPMNGNPKDTSGNRYNGIAQRGATLTSDRFGRVKTAYHFDGTANGYIEVSHTRFISGNAISVSFWFTTAASGFSGYFIMSNDFAIYYDSNLSEIRFYIYTYENSMNSAAVRITENTWTHIVGTYDGTDIMIYTNGVVRAITHWPGTMGDLDRPLTIGGWPMHNYLNCAMDDFRIYDGILCTDEICQLYNYHD